MTKMNNERIPKSVMTVAWLFIIGALAPMLDSTMVNIALNKLSQDFHVSLAQIQWGVTGYVLALAVAVPISGWLSDRTNIKKSAIISILAFGLFSFLTGHAEGIAEFIIFRIFQGFAAGVYTTVGMSLMMKIAPKDKLGRLMSMITIPMIFGPIIGPVIGGLLLQYAGWHWIFYINIPIVILAMILIMLKMPNFEPNDSGRKMDLIGIVLLSGISVSLIYSMMEGSNEAFFFNPRMLMFLVLGLFLAVLYYGWNHHKNGEVILPLKFFRNKNFLAANVGMLLGSIINNGPLLLLPLFFQNIKNFSAVQAALILIPQGVGMLIARPIVGRIVDDIGAKKVVIFSLILTLIGSVPFIFVSSTTSLVWLGVALFIRGVGLSGVQLPMMTDIYIGISPKDTPIASVANQMLQNIGMSFGSAIASAAVTAVANSAFSSGLTAKGTMLLGYQFGFLVTTIVVLLIFIPVKFLSEKE